MKAKHHISDDITSTPSKKNKPKEEEQKGQDDMDSTTPDPTQPDTEITYTRKHNIGDPIKKKQDPLKDNK